MLLLAQQNKILNQLCQLILDSQKEICFVSIINDRGIVIESKEKDSAISKLQKSRYEMFFMESALQHRMNNEFDHEFGTAQYTLTERECETFFSFPFHNLQILAIVKSCKNPKLISKKIISISEKYDNEFDEINMKNGFESTEVVV